MGDLNTEYMKTEGLDEVDKMLAEMGPALGLKAMRSGLMAATKPTFLLARQNAKTTGLKGYDSDAMAAAMSRGVVKRSPTQTVLWIGPRNKNKKALAIYNSFHDLKKPLKRLNYFHLVEWGATRGKQGKMIAQPFMRPAFLATSKMAVRNLGKEIGKAIEKVKRKHASQ